MAEIDDLETSLSGDYQTGEDKPRRLQSFESLMRGHGGEEAAFISSAGIKYTFEDDPYTGDLLIRGYQDVYAILEANQAMLTENSGYSADKAFKRVASIPLALRNKIWIEEGWDPYRPDLYPERYKRLMNDPDFRKLRTAGGRV